MHAMANPALQRLWITTLPASLRPAKKRHSICSTKTKNSFLASDVMWQGLQVFGITTGLWAVLQLACGSRPERMKSFVADPILGADESQLKHAQAKITYLGEQI